MLADRIRRALVWLVDRSGRRPWLVVTIAVVLVVASLATTHALLGIDTDTDHMFSSQLEWRQRSIAFDHEFPQFSNTLVAVVRAPTPEEARATATALARMLASDHKHFLSVRTPGISPFLDREGLLLLGRTDLNGVLNTMLQAQPLMGPLASDPSARGLFNGLGLLVEGVRHGMGSSLKSYNVALDHVATTLDDALHGKYAPLSWQTLLTPTLADLSGDVQFVLTDPVQDHHALEPGAAATRALVAAAATLPEVRAGRATVDYTGSVPLADEQFQSLSEHVVPMIVGSALLLLLWLVLALRSWRLIVPVVVTLLAGLVYTLGFAAIAVGRLNLVSVAFTVLFVGLAVDFGIQLSVRMHARQDDAHSLANTMHETAVVVVGQIGLAALATACGFLAFAPTHFRGVAELGIIAGVGMLIALACTLTILPALLVLLSGHGPQHAGHPLPGGAAADRWLARYRWPVLGVFALLAVGGIWGAFTLRFDANPLHTQRQDGEAVRTLNSLRGNPTTNPFTIDVLAKNLDAARTLEDRLGKLPEVAQTASGADFVPLDQTPKLQQIRQASALMFTVLEPPTKLPAPTPAELRDAAQEAARKIDEVRDSVAETSPALLRIGAALGKLSTAPEPTLANADRALVQFLPEVLDQIGTSLSAEPVTVQSLPAALRRDWFTADGRVRIQVTPTAEASTTSGLRRFVRAVRTIAPRATGSAITTVEAADTILGSFQQAALYAFLAIAVVLLAVLRRVRDAVLVLGTLAMSALLTALMARLAGMSINYANIIALPLLLGVGVSFNVYFVMNWRSGRLDFMGSPTARAILFSALTTATAFGTLAVSSNPGTASMGLVLLLSLLAVLTATFAFLPALLYTLSRAGGLGATAAPRL